MACDREKSTSESLSRVFESRPTFLYSVLLLEGIRIRQGRHVSVLKASRNRSRFHPLSNSYERNAFEETQRGMMAEWLKPSVSSPGSSEWCIRFALTQPSE